jgi:Ca2+/H+ antiporter, TMEM165/GDT1 family
MVWIGVVAAFGVQCLVAVAAGRLITLLPEKPVKLVAAALFAAGAFILLRGARRADAQEKQAEAEYESRLARDAKTGWRAVTASFLVLFAAEWGDLSQLLTASLVAQGRSVYGVFIGSWVGLAVVSAAAVILGRVLLRWIRLSVIRAIGGVVCAVLAGLTVWYALA